MEIIVGKTAGFCYGVRRAVEGSEKELETNKNQKVYCLGELVHNKQVVLDLEEKGLDFIEEINEVKESDSKVIIRAHGVSKNVYEKAENQNIKLIDYTCPNVLKIHKIAEEYQKEGYYIFLTGTENHPEIIGTISYCGEHFSLITDEKDINNAIEELNKSNIKKLLLISQTTYSIKKFENIVKILERKVNKDVELLIKNTICLATEQRQKETKKISQNVDAMIIIGGKNSSNTKKLYELAKENCKNTICIETKDEIKMEQIEHFNKIGIMAGASTPQKSIEDVINVLKK